MQVKINLHDLIEDTVSTYDGRVHVSAQIELEELFDSIADEQEIDVDIHELLAENRQIAHVWGIGDVQQQRPDLADEQAWAVLQAVEKQLDSNYGITWDTLEIIADELYPKPEGPWQARIDVSVANYDREAAVEHFTELAAHIEHVAVNSTTRASFDPESLHLLEPDSTTGK
jgi:hypothetical protein